MKFQYTEGQANFNDYKKKKNNYTNEKCYLIFLSILIWQIVCVCMLMHNSQTERLQGHIFCINNHKASNNKLYYSDLGGHQRAWHAISNQMKHLTKSTERGSLP